MNSPLTPPFATCAPFSKLTSMAPTFIPPHVMSMSRAWAEAVHARARPHRQAHIASHLIARRLYKRGGATSSVPFGLNVLALPARRWPPHSLGTGGRIDVLSTLLPTTIDETN